MGTLRQKSLGHAARLLAHHGGRQYELVRVEFVGGTTQYPSFVVHRTSRVVVRDEQGQRQTLKLFGSVVERAGQYTLFSYVVD